jgi:hypothetical protein
VHKLSTPFLLSFANYISGNVSRENEEQVDAIAYLRILNDKTETGSDSFEWGESVGYFLYGFQRKYDSGFRKFCGALTRFNL